MSVKHYYLRIDCYGENPVFGVDKLRVGNNSYCKFLVVYIDFIELVITAKSGAHGYFKVDGKLYAAEAKTYTIDITNLFTSNNNYLSFYIVGDVDTYNNDNSEIEFYTSGENAAKLVISYEAEGGDDLLLEKHYYKTFELPDGVAHMTDLYARNSIISICSFPAEKSLMNMNIQHIFKNGTGNSGYGVGFKLNLDEQIKSENGKDYYYDALGNKYLIKGEGVIASDLIYAEKVPPSVKELNVYKNATNKPIKWIYSGNVVKGFDSNGDLVMISDSCKNCYKLVRVAGKINWLEKYSDNNRLAQMSFQYNSSGNLQIINFGNYEGVDLTYDEKNNLTFLYFTNGKYIRFRF